MSRSRLAALALLLPLCGTTSCASILQRSADEIRRQQVKSKPHATGTDSRNKRKRGTSTNKKNDKSDVPRAIVHGATYDAASGLVEGAADTLDQPKTREKFAAVGDRLQTRVEDLSRGAGEAAIDGMNTKLPEMRGGIVKMLDQIGKEIGLDPEKSLQLIMREVGRGLRKEVRPQVRLLVEEDVLGAVEDKMGDAFGPKLKDRVRDNVKPALDELTKDIPDLAEQLAESTARGFSAGMAKSLDPNREGSLGAVVRGQAGDAREAVDKWIAYALLLAFVIAVVVIIVALFKFLTERGERKEAQRARVQADEDRDRQERMLRLVTTAIRDAGEQDSLEAFRRAIKGRTSNEEQREAAADLNHFLTREGLKLSSR